MASYTPITNTLEFPVAYKPIGAFPLDARSMFGSYASAVAAAATAELPGSSESIYYIGQTLTVFENDEVKTYNIQADKTLKEVGSTVLADGKTIEVGDDGALVCPACADTQCKRCEACGNLYFNNEITYNREKEMYLCPWCSRDADEGKDIKRYNLRNYINF